MIRELAKRALEPRLSIRFLQLLPGAGGSRRHTRRITFIVFGTIELAEELPAGAISGQMVEAQVGRDGLQPAGRCGARRDHGEALKRAEEHRLRDVLRLGRAAEEAHRCGEDHVLVFPDERLEPIRVGHCRFVGHLLTG